MKDFLGQDINIGDTIVLASLFGRSAALVKRKVIGFPDKGAIRTECEPRYPWQDQTKKTYGTIQYPDRCIVINRLLKNE